LGGLADGEDHGRDEDRDAEAEYERWDGAAEIHHNLAGEWG
jgi:hypothetical protein